MGSLTKKNNNDRIKLMQKMTNKNMKTILTGLKKNTMTKKARKIKEKLLDWNHDFANMDTVTRHHNSIYLKSGNFKKERNQSKKKVVEIKSRQSEGIDFEKVNKFRVCLKEKYRCKNNFNKIYKEWDGKKQKKIVIGDIKRISSNMGYSLNKKECALLMAFEDHNDKGYLLPFELMKFVFGERKLKENVSQTKPLKNSSFKNVKQDIMKQTDTLRKNEQTKIIEGLVKNNRNYILREVNKICRKNEKKVSYNDIIQEKYLDIVKNFEEQENLNDGATIMHSHPRNGLLTERKSPSKRSLSKQEKTNYSQQRKLHEINKIEMKNFREILSKMDGFIGRKSQLRHFSEQFTKIDNPKFVDLEQLFAFLNSSKRKLNRRSNSFNIRQKDIGGWSKSINYLEWEKENLKHKNMPVHSWNYCFKLMQKVRIIRQETILEDTTISLRISQRI